MVPLLHKFQNCLSEVLPYLPTKTRTDLAVERECASSNITRLSSTFSLSFGCCEGLVSHGQVTELLGGIGSGHCLSSWTLLHNGDLSLGSGGGSPHTECCVPFKDLTHTNIPFSSRWGIWSLAGNVPPRHNGYRGFFRTAALGCVVHNREALIPQKYGAIQACRVVPLVDTGFSQ